jgi:hypothetical protein
MRPWHAFAHPDAVRRSLAATAFWDGEENWRASAAILAKASPILADLRAKGFTPYWTHLKAPGIHARATALQRELSAIDLIGAQQRFMSRQLAPRIDVYLSAFSEPHRIRIVGHRFLTSYTYPRHIVMRNAALEGFHPFLLANRPVTARSGRSIGTMRALALFKLAGHQLGVYSYSWRS